MLDNFKEWDGLLIMKGQVNLVEIIDLYRKDVKVEYSWNPFGDINPENENELFILYERSMILIPLV